MKPNTAHLIYFSPTGTTRKVLRCIAFGIGVEDTKEVNLSVPQTSQVLNGTFLLPAFPISNLHFAHIAVCVPKIAPLMQQT